MYLFFEEHTCACVAFLIDVTTLWGETFDRVDGGRLCVSCDSFIIFNSYRERERDSLSLVMGT